MKTKQLRLYIHIPFCERKCLYCDFLSAPADENTKDLYVRALLKEIEQKAEQYREYSVNSVFIGGGTPSILKSSQIMAVMQQIRSFYSLEEEAEITIEVNPGTVTEDSIKDYQRAGINRVSIGLQSTHNMELKELGRIHTYEMFLQTFQRSREAGIQNINVDLMSALPGQTLDAYRITLERIIQLRPEHISAYSLIVEENTPFFERQDSLQLPEEETERKMYELTRELLEKAGYHRYEISNYALPGKECSHNKGYWVRNHYLGFGLGAASLIENVRWNQTRSLAKYLKQEFTPENTEILTEKEQMEEFMFLGLRLREGVSEQKFKEIFKKDIESMYGEILQKLLRQELIERTQDGTLRLSDRGIDISNYVMAKFLF